MVLDLTRDLDQWQTFGSPREARARMRRLYDEDRWLGQKYFPLLVVEKDTGASVQADGRGLADAVRVIAWLWLTQIAA